MTGHADDAGCNLTVHRAPCSLGSHTGLCSPPRSRGRSRRKWTTRSAWCVTPTSATARCCPTWRPPSAKCCASGPCPPCSSRMCPLLTPGEIPLRHIQVVSRDCREGVTASLCVRFAALGNTPSPRVPGSSSTSGLCTTMRRNGTSLRSSILVGCVIPILSWARGWQGGCTRRGRTLGDAWCWEVGSCSCLGHSHLSVPAAPARDTRVMNSGRSQAEGIDPC